MLLFVFCGSSLAFAEDSVSTQQSANKKIYFIYLHGSNCNREKDIEFFKRHIKKLHKNIIINFNENEKMQDIFFEQKSLEIAEEPEFFVWGDRSKFQLDLMAEMLDISKIFNPKLAQLTRSMLARYFHDAIWVQEDYNMEPILDDLHKEVIAHQKNGDKVVLLGYSAGSFITHRYVLAYSPVLDADKFFNRFAVNLSKSDVDKLASYKIDKTCMNAINKMDSVYFREDEENFTVLVDKDKFFDEYKNLNNTTKNACYADENFKGVIHFGSPLFLFSSNLTNPQTALGKYSGMVLANYVAKGHFWLALNFKEDPLGYAADVKISAKDVEKFLSKNFDKNTGFVYDDSNISCYFLFAFAHYGYLLRDKMFAKEMTKSFVKAYNSFYDIKVK